MKAADSLAALGAAAKKSALAEVAAEGTAATNSAASALAADLGRSPATVAAAKVAVPAVRLDNKQELPLIL